MLRSNILTKLELLRTILSLSMSCACFLSHHPRRQGSHQLESWEMFLSGRVPLCLPLKEAGVARSGDEDWCPSLSSNVTLFSLSLTILSSYIEQSATNFAAVVRKGWSREDCMAGALRGTSSWCKGMKKWASNLMIDVRSSMRDRHLNLCRIAFVVASKPLREAHQLTMLIEVRSRYRS